MSRRALFAVPLALLLGCEAQIVSAPGSTRPSEVVAPSRVPYVCPGPEAAKDSSRGSVRLTGEELANSYQRVVSPEAWSAMKPNLYLLPEDRFTNSVTGFTGAFIPDTLAGVVQFNDLLSVTLTSSDARTQKFFGTCASSATGLTRSCLSTFLNANALALFRAPATAEDLERLWALYQGLGSREGLKAIVQALFDDPRFLYHLELGGSGPDAQGRVALTPYEVANRISYTLTAAPPDAALTAAARDGSVSTPEAAAAQVARLAQTDAFKARVAKAVRYGLSAAATPQVPRDSPVFLDGIDTTTLAQASVDELEAFVRHVVFEQGGTLRALFSSTAAFPTTAELARVMGTQAWQPGAPPRAAPNHPGVLSRPLLNLAARTDAPLILRGVRIRRGMLCQDLPPPPANVNTAALLPTGLSLRTTSARDYYSQITAGGSCSGCHGSINGLGFLTANYDTLGRHRTEERVFDTETGALVATHPIDASGTPRMSNHAGDTRSFDGLADFERALADEPDLASCLAKRVHEFMTNAAADPIADACALASMREALGPEQQLRELFVRPVKQPSLFFKTLR